MEKESDIATESSNGVTQSSSDTFENHMILEGMKITNLDRNTESREHFFRYEMLDNDKAFAATILTEVVLHELVDGDGENENHGSLKNCRGDIWNFLYHHGQYSYADLIFTIKEKTFFN